MEKTYLPRLIAWELTRTCYLNCKHCRGTATNETYPHELDLFEIKTILNNIKSSFSPIIILTGGEPLLRNDIYQIASYGTQLGLRMVLATCSVPLTSDMINKLKSSGIQRISLSLDGKNAATHDLFRGSSGSYEMVLSNAKKLKENDMDFQINTTLHQGNYKELPEIMKLAYEINAKAFHPFLMVTTGRAVHLSNEQLTQEQYETTLNWIFNNRLIYDMEIKPTCAPQYNRILKQQATDLKQQRLSEGCMGGKSFAFISHLGKVQICGFLDTEAGDLRKDNYDFTKIWNHSPFFQEIRNIDAYEGKCGHCGYRQICGGCRARAFANTQNYLAEESQCIHQPELN